MSSVNQEFARRVKEEKILRRKKLEGLSEKPTVKTKERLVVKEEVVLVRARNEDGKFIKDDPTTEKNEAWVEKPKPKVKKAKPKTTKKKVGRPKKV